MSQQVKQFFTRKKRGDKEATSQGGWTLWTLLALLFLADIFQGVLRQTDGFIQTLLERLFSLV